MYYNYSFEQFCPRENKNVIVNSGTGTDGRSEMVCLQSRNCKEKCDCIDNLSVMINTLRTYI